MNVSYSLILLTVLCGFVSAQVSEEPDELSRRTTSTSTKRSATLGKSLSKRNTEKKIDLTFPGCGLQLPQLDENGRPRTKTKKRGKRSKSQKISFFTREKREIMPLIVGGAIAEEHSWPWMVSLFSEASNTSITFICGASLISERYILTAAHCFKPKRGIIDPSKYYANVGAHILGNGTWYFIKKILLHPDYKSSEHYNDIAILEVKNHPVKLSEKVYPVCLPSYKLIDKINRDNYNVTATGWGTTSLNGNHSMELQEVTMPIVPLKECSASYSTGRKYSKGITNTLICAGYKEGGKDSCEGDSGGPLVAKLKGDSFVQVGVVSFGMGCAKPGFPGVYARLTSYLEWISDNTDLGKA